MSSQLLQGAYHAGWICEADTACPFGGGSGKTGVRVAEARPAFFRDENKRAVSAPLRHFMKAWRRNRQCLEGATAAKIRPPANRSACGRSEKFLILARRREPVLYVRQRHPFATGRASTPRRKRATVWTFFSRCFRFRHRFSCVPPPSASFPRYDSSCSSISCMASSCAADIEIYGG